MRYQPHNFFFFWGRLIPRKWFRWEKSCLSFLFYRRRWYSRLICLLALHRAVETLRMSPVGLRTLCKQYELLLTLSLLLIQLCSFVYILTWITIILEVNRDAVSDWRMQNYMLFLNTAIAGDGWCLIRDLWLVNGTKYTVLWRMAEENVAWLAKNKYLCTYEWLYLYSQASFQV